MAVRMYIAKFQREVLIDEDHPLAVAQRTPAADAAPVAPSAASEADGDGGQDATPRRKRREAK